MTRTFSLEPKGYHPDPDFSYPKNPGNRNPQQKMARFHRHDPKCCFPDPGFSYPQKVAASREACVVVQLWRGGGGGGGGGESFHRWREGRIARNSLKPASRQGIIQVSAQPRSKLLPQPRRARSVISPMANSGKCEGGEGWPPRSMVVRCFSQRAGAKL